MTRFKGLYVGGKWAELLYCAIANIFAILHAIKLNFRNGLIRFLGFDLELERSKQRALTRDLAIKQVYQL